MTEKKRRGFALMDENKKREIARSGGIAAHRKGTAHKFISEEAREAGQLMGSKRRSLGSTEAWSVSLAGMGMMQRVSQEAI